GILELLAQLPRRAALEDHRRVGGRQVPVRRARRLAQAVAVLVAVTGRARDAVGLGAPGDVHAVRARVVVLQRRVAVRVAVHAPRVLQYLVERREPGPGLGGAVVVGARRRAPG